MDEDPLLSFAPAPAAEGPATPVMARLLGRRADERAAARSAAAADTPPTLPNVGAATRGMAAAAAASTAGQQPGPQQDGSSAADGDAASAPYLQVPSSFPGQSCLRGMRRFYQLPAQRVHAVRDLE